MLIDNTTIGIYVSSLEKAAQWYAKLFGENVKTIKPTDSIVQFEYYPGCWLQLIEGEPQPSCHIRFGVCNIKKERDRLEGLGISVETLFVIDGVVAVHRFDDPFGNQLSIYQELNRFPLKK